MLRICKCGQKTIVRRTAGALRPVCCYCREELLPWPVDTPQYLAEQEREKLRKDFINNIIAYTNDEKIAWRLSESKDNNKIFIAEIGFYEVVISLDRLILQGVLNVHDQCVFDVEYDELRNIKLAVNEYHRRRWEYATKEIIEILRKSES